MPPAPGRAGYADLQASVQSRSHIGQEPTATAYPRVVPPGQIDPYATLGVARYATAAQIARAYHRLAKELHPDHGGEATGERMRQVNAAWEILSDPGKRSAWDSGNGLTGSGTPLAPTPAARSAPSQEWAEWPAERLPRRYAVYPPRPRPGERRRSDSPWLVGGLGSLILVGLLIVAGGDGDPGHLWRGRVRGLRPA
ncbi:MAG: hypothetical protein E6I62_01180 [Chloroflexi bacterium]|nr:MAG: hypothetical protein E6I62_01180 [Chloroflexota bacterium]